MSEITHERAKEVAKEHSYFFWLQYIENQEQRDDLSKAKDEIIKLYRQYVFSDKLSQRITIREKITALEIKYHLRKLDCEVSV
jgi:hypothetical protein